MSKKVLTGLILVLALCALFSTQVFAEASRFTSTVSYTKSSVVADGVDLVQFKIYAYDSTNQVVPGTKIYFASSRGDSDTFFGGLPAGYTDPVYYVTTDSYGSALVNVKSNLSGVAKIGFGLTNPQDAGTSIYQYLVGNPTSSSASAQVISAIDITYTTPIIGENGKIIFTVGSPYFTINNEPRNLDIAPFLKDGHVFVVMRGVAESFDATLSFDMSTQAISYTKGNTAVMMFLNSRMMVKNGMPIEMDTAPFICNGRVVVPVKYVLEAFGYKLVENSNRVVITLPNTLIDDNKHSVIDKKLISIFYVGVYQYYFNGKFGYAEIPAFIKDTHTFTTVRPVVETLNLTASWDESAKKITFTKGKGKVEMVIDSKTLLKNGKKVVMDTAPFIKDGRTVIPIKYVCEAFGYHVLEDGKTAYVSQTPINLYL